MSIHFSSTVTIVYFQESRIVVEKTTSSSTVFVGRVKDSKQTTDYFDALLNRGPRSDIDTFRSFILQLANRSPSLFIEDESDDSWEDSSESDTSSDDED